MNTSLQSQESRISRRVGQKALQADRIHSIISSRGHTKSAKKWRMPRLRPLPVVAACIIFIGAGIFGFIGLRQYQAQAADARQAAIAKQNVELKARSAAADACRRKKVEQKADLIGKVTYDELYDYGECDK